MYIGSASFRGCSGLLCGYVGQFCGYVGLFCNREAEESGGTLCTSIFVYVYFLRVRAACLLSELLCFSEAKESCSKPMCWALL